MTSQKYMRRNKQEYEDLDEICIASKEFDRPHEVERFRHNSAKFPSDTAINSKTAKAHFKKLADQNDARNLVTGSIPCVFYVGLNMPGAYLDKNNGDKGKNIKSGEQTGALANLTRKYKYWLISYIFLYGLYLVVGAFCFQALESSEESNVRNDFVSLRNNFLSKYPQINENDFNDILASAISASNSGVKFANNSTTMSHRHIGDLLLFTTSMVTTIGYGHVSPLTDEGKVFCIIYTAIGIPLTLVLLSTMVKHSFKQTNKLLRILIRKFQHAFEIFSIQMLHLSILAVSFLIIFLIMPAVVYSSIEPRWSFLDGFYFCFTSLTTVGLGDLVPDTNDIYPNGALYKIITAFYLIIGLIGIMMVVTVFYTIPQLNIGVWLIESSADEVKKDSLEQINFHKTTDKNNTTNIQVESTTSSSKTLRTIL